jgi:purine-nucleoside phosphorylase
MTNKSFEDEKSLYSKIHDAADFILLKTNLRPKSAVALGTGLGGITDIMDVDVSIPFEKIPGFGVSTVTGHAGELTVGTVEGTEVFVLNGRFHLYEGYKPIDVAIPIWVLKTMGVKNLIITNAAGGLNPHFRPGEIMIINDHINLTWQNPLIGINTDEIGPRFPDMTQVYDKKFIEITEAEAKSLGIRLNRGVYIGILGPSLETPAETRMLRLLGGDATGMSTIMEVIAAMKVGLKVLGLSVISNVNLPDAMKPILIEDIIAGANAAGPDLIKLVSNVLKRIIEIEEK